MNEGKYVFTQVLSFLARFDSEDGIFITRAKDNMKFEIMSSNFNIDESSGVVGNHLIRLTGLKTHLWVAISESLSWQRSKLFIIVHFLLQRQIHC